MRALPARELGLAVFALLALLALLEGATRLLLSPPRYHRGFPFLELDPELGHRSVSNYRDEVSTASGRFTFALNAEGFRGRDLPAAGSSAAARRIAFLGDSFLVGRALPEDALVTSLVERALAARDVDAEVYNLSTIDYGTGQELMLLERFAPRLRPDDVVLALYPGNDVANNAIGLAGLTRVSPGDPIRPYTEPARDGALHVHWVSPLRAFARRSSRLFALLEQRLFAVEEGRDAKETSRARRLRLGYAPFEHDEIFRRHDPGHRWETAWRTTASLLQALDERCEALGARLLVLVIPTAEQVERTYRSVEMDVATRRHAGRPVDQILDWNLPERRLDAVFRAHGIEAAFLLAPLREAAESDRDVYASDGHLGATGHRVAAEVVLARLLDTSRAGALPVGGAPVRRLRDARDASPRLDFRTRRHRDHLGGGWVVWRDAAEEEGDAEAWGWWTAPHAEIVLPLAGDAFVLRGWLPADARVPVELRIGGIGRHALRIEETGAFEVRVLIEAGKLATSSEGYVAVRWDASETQRLAGVPIGLIVREIGFADAGEGET